MSFGLGCLVVEREGAVGRRGAVGLLGVFGEMGERASSGSGFGCGRYCFCNFLWVGLSEKKQ